jgi:hypothetical protein
MFPIPAPRATAQAHRTPVDLRFLAEEPPGPAAQMSGWDLPHTAWPATMQPRAGNEPPHTVRSKDLIYIERGLDDTNPSPPLMPVDHPVRHRLDDVGIGGRDRGPSGESSRAIRGKADWNSCVNRGKHGHIIRPPASADVIAGQKWQPVTRMTRNDRRAGCIPV